jgi:hypothetical protein
MKIDSVQSYAEFEIRKIRIEFEERISTILDESTENPLGYRAYTLGGTQYLKDAIFCCTSGMFYSIDGYFVCSECFTKYCKRNDIVYCAIEGE